MSLATSGGWAAVRQELLLALEITALTSLTFARPILDVMGDSESTFTARHVTPPTVVLWALLVVVLPALIFVGLGLSSRLAPERVRKRARRLAHCVLVGLLAGLAAWRFGIDQTDRGGSALALVLLGAVAGLAIGGIRWWLRSRELAAAFLQYAAVAPVVFLGQFVFSSSAGDWIRSPPTVDSDAAEQVADQLGEDAPPVVVIVLDELPTAALLDGDGEIDAGLYPNIAELADSSTWYPNHTSTASKTPRAVPSLVTGTYTTGEDDPRARSANLFTLLGESHDLEVNEAITDLCPPDYCGRDTIGTVGRLLGDSRETWVDGVRDVHPWEILQLPGLDDNRYDAAQAWIEGLDLAGSDEPPMVYLHVLLPHTPWIYLPDGTQYQNAIPHGMAFFRWPGDGAGIDEAKRRLVLQTQATDRLVGELMHELRSESLYDDALVVLTADHGYGLTESAPARDLSSDNVDDILWVPLLIKEPGQVDGDVSNDNVEQVDVLPTVAKILGVELPWEVDGFPVSEAEDQRDDVKTVALGKADPLLDAQNGDPIYQFDANQWFGDVVGTRPYWAPGAASGRDAVWGRTEHADLLREQVDDLTVGEPVAGALDVVDPGSWGSFDTDEPLPLVIYGTAGATDGDVAEGQVIAFVLDGTVAGFAEVGATPEHPIQGLLLPDLYEDGDNELSAYVVEGDPGDETLRPLDLNF